MSRFQKSMQSIKKQIRTIENRSISPEKILMEMGKYYQDGIFPKNPYIREIIENLVPSINETNRLMSYGDIPKDKYYENEANQKQLNKLRQEVIKK